MDPSELSDDEHLALVALVHHVAGADGIISERELAEMREIGLETGGPRFADGYRRAKKRFKTPADALEFAARVEREPARHLIHTMLVDLANTDEMSGGEAQVIGKLRLMWGLSAP